MKTLRLRWRKQLTKATLLAPGSSLMAVSDEAHRFGLKVAAHAISEEGIWNCIKGGIDTIEHGHFLTDTAMDAMIRNHIFWVPTLFVYRQIADGENIRSYAREKAREIV